MSCLHTYDVIRFYMRVTASLQFVIDLLTRHTSQYAAAVSPSPRSHQGADVDANDVFCLYCAVEEEEMCHPDFVHSHRSRLLSAGWIASDVILRIRKIQTSGKLSCAVMALCALADVDMSVRKIELFNRSSAVA